MIRQAIGVGALVSLALLAVTVAGQVAGFGQCFQVFRVPGMGDYYAFGFVIGGRWIFWHEFALAAIVLPVARVAMGVQRARRERRYPGGRFA